MIEETKMDDLEALKDEISEILIRWFSDCSANLLPDRSNQIADDIVRVMRSGYLHIIKRYVPDESDTQYPREDGDVLVLGPGVFVSSDEQVLSWRGRNYVPQPAPPGDVRYEVDINRGPFGLIYGIVYRVDGDGRKEIDRVSSLMGMCGHTRESVIEAATKQVREYLEPTTVVLDV